MTWFGKDRTQILIERMFKSRAFQEIASGEGYKLLDCNIVDLVRRYNQGEIEVLFSEECQRFIGSDIDTNGLMELINTCESLKAEEQYYQEEIMEQKNGMIYDENATCIGGLKGYHKPLTYKQVGDALAIANSLLHDKRLYQLLKFFHKNEILQKGIARRKRVIENLRKEDPRRKEFMDLLAEEDKNVGIVRIDDSSEGVSVKLGTRKEMQVSDLIGIPFTPDMDEPGYDYGPHGDFWHEPRKVVKEFYPEGTTLLHKKLIQQDTFERSREEKARDSEEMGFIDYNGFTITITKGKLIRSGIRPEGVNWQPLIIDYRKIANEDLLEDLTNPRHLKRRLKIKAKTLKGS